MGMVVKEEMDLMAGGHGLDLERAVPPPKQPPANDGSMCFALD